MMEEADKHYQLGRRNVQRRQGHDSEGKRQVLCVSLLTWSGQIGSGSQQPDGVMRSYGYSQNAYEGETVLKTLDAQKWSKLTK